jgi:hypothetical protein
MPDVFAQKCAVQAISHQRWFVRPSIRQDMHRAIGYRLLVLELLLERHEPLAKRVSRGKPLGLLATIGADDNGKADRTP